MAGNAPIRILVVDDHSIVCDGLCALLDQEPGFKIVGCATTGADAVFSATRLQPDIVIMDLMLPTLNGIEATRRITAGASLPKVVVLSACPGAGHVSRALRAGASAYVSKDAGSDELLRALRLVLAGQRFVSPSIGASPAETDVLEAVPGSPLDCLSPREHDVLRRIAAGCTSSDIARALSLSRTTVDTYRARMMSKLGIVTRSALIRLARQYELPTM